MRIHYKKENSLLESAVKRKNIFAIYFTHPYLED